MSDSDSDDMGDVAPDVLREGAVLIKTKIENIRATSAAISPQCAAIFMQPAYEVAQAEDDVDDPSLVFFAAKAVNAYVILNPYFNSIQQWGDGLAVSDAVDADVKTTVLGFISDSVLSRGDHVMNMAKVHRTLPDTDFIVKYVEPAKVYFVTMMQGLSEGLTLLARHDITKDEFLRDFVNNRRYKQLDPGSSSDADLVEYAEADKTFREVEAGVRPSSSAAARGADRPHIPRAISGEKAFSRPSRAGYEGMSGSGMRWHTAPVPGMYGKLPGAVDAKARSVSAPVGSAAAFAGAGFGRAGGGTGSSVLDYQKADAPGLFVSRREQKHVDKVLGSKRDADYGIKFEALLEKHPDMSMREACGNDPFCEGIYRETHKRLGSIHGRK